MYLFGDNNNNIDANELNHFIDKHPDYQYIDVRTKEEVSLGMIDGFIHLEDFLIADGNHNLNKDKKVVAICHSRIRSANVANILEKEGYDVINVIGGYLEYKNYKWRADGVI